MTSVHTFFLTSTSAFILTPPSAAQPWLLQQGGLHGAVAVRGLFARAVRWQAGGDECPHAWSWRRMAQARRRLLHIAGSKGKASGGDAERIVRAHHARILTIESEFTILEKTGYPDEIKELFTELKPFGLLEFVRSGRVAISKPMKTLEEHIEDMNNVKIIL